VYKIGRLQAAGQIGGIGRKILLLLVVVEIGARNVIG
jgi:hypothetical protein